MGNAKTHWEEIYRTREYRQVSWYAEHLRVSLELIAALKLDRRQPIIDVGAGASTLVDDLLSLGYEDISVLDVSAAALDISRARLGTAAEKVRWYVDDLLHADLAGRTFDLWHDRAVFHFLTEEPDRMRYREQLLRHLNPNGFVIVSTFADDGPTRCSGLDVRRHSEADLEAFLGLPFQTVEVRRTIHTTPGGSEQRFVNLAARRTT